MKLVIAEKPSMARDIAAALGAAKRGEGFIEGAGYVVTWAVGHLIELDTPEAYDARYKSWRAADLPIIPERFTYHAVEKTASQFKVIKQLLERKDVTGIVNACDAGREGELIFDLIYRQAGAKQPVERLWISSLTADAIREGFRNLKPAAEYHGLRASAHARQRADWLVGLNASRAQTLKARQAGYSSVFSVGRVQTPTLALIAARDEEIRTFVPTNYFQVVADFKAPAGEYQGVWFNKDGNRLDHKDAAEAIVYKVTGKTGHVEKVEKKAVKEKPPLLYDLTALQRAANARFGFPAQQTLDVAQSLYEKKYLTYPRTSSRHLSKDVAKEAARHLKAVEFGPYAQFVAEINRRGLKLGKRHVDDAKVTDHHAVIPTDQQVNPAQLSPDEKRVYDLVVRRFLAAFYPDAEVERTTVITAVEGERFATRGSVVLKPEWRAVDPPSPQKAAGGKEDEEDDSAAIPPVKKDDPAETVKAEAVAKQTKAPPRYTEASLLAAMESAGKNIDDEELRLVMKDAGLGTPATRAAIIEGLIQREYLTREKKALVTTEKGRLLLSMLPVGLLKSAELTGQWEAKLARMARGEYTFGAFWEEVKAMTTEAVHSISGAQVERAAADSPLAAKPRAIERPEKAMDCPKCAAAGRAGFLVERSGAQGSFLACSEGREVCGFTSDVPKNAKQRKAMSASRCPQCGGAMRFRLAKEKGKDPFLSCAAYPACRGILPFVTEARA
jgi:DNA topoisomerase III